MRHRLVSLILAALLPLLLVLPAAAQDNTTPPFVLCGDLKDADCAILEESALAMLDVTSSAFDIRLDSSISGIPDLPVDPIDFTLGMKGTWAIDDSAKNGIRSLGALAGMDPAGAAQALSKQMPQAMADLYSGLSFDTSFTWEVPQAVADVISSDSNVPFPPTLTWNMRMVDGMMYIDLSEFKALAPELDTIKADWIGFDMVGLMKRSLEQNRQNAGSSDGAIATSVATGAITAQTLKWLQEFTTVKRLDDVSVENQKAAVFQFTPDVLGFLTSKTFRTEFLKSLTALSANGTQDPEMEKNIGMLGLVAPILFRDFTFDSTSTIGLDDYYRYAAQTKFKWDLSAIMTLAAMGNGSVLEKPAQKVAPVVGFTLDTNFSGYNEPVAIVAPKDVEIIPLDQMSPGDTSLLY